MNDMRLIDKSKKSNIKCENCRHFVANCKRVLNGQFKDYWNRCKQFDWRKGKRYVGEAQKGEG